MARKTRTVYHPRLRASREVPAAQIDAWKAQGWRLSPPKGVADQAHTDEKTTPPRPSEGAEHGDD